MTAELALIGGAAIGMAAGALLIPATRRELAAAVARSDDSVVLPGAPVVAWQRVLLILASGIVPGIVMYRVGWSYVAIPPLLLFLALVQLAYCDMKQRLLPKTMVHATMLSVAISAFVAAPLINNWGRLWTALLCSAAISTLLFTINLIRPAWIAFGDVRLAPVVGLGLGWISPMALLEGFLLANVLASVVGIVLMVSRKGGRKTAVPFGFFMAIAVGIITLVWS